IGGCALFVPIISANTQARLEGYFRIEWKLAAQRTHAMADEKAFLVPVVIDDTRDTEAKVPAEFKAVQWTRLRDEETHPGFAVRVRTLLVDGTPSPQGEQPLVARATPPAVVRRGARRVLALVGIAIALCLAGGAV